MKDKTLMKLMLECPNFIREKLLTDTQIELFEFVQDRTELTSAELAFHKEISIQYASVILANLAKKGYLKRMNRGAVSGGDEYVYKVAI